MKKGYKAFNFYKNQLQNSLNNSIDFFQQFN